MTCSHCQHTNPEGSRFCNLCGTRLATSSEPSTLASALAKQAERRQLTVLFCDLVGSTPLSERLDPEEYRQVILNYQQVAEKVIKAHGGHIAQYLGDGLLVYFGYPKGLEDAPKAAVQAGLGVIRSVARANEGWAKEGKTTISIRIGVHTGLVVVDDHLALGDTVNIAARLEGLAPVNGMVISRQVSKLVQGWFEVKSLGEQALKGISQPMELFQVLAESGVNSKLEAARNRGLSPLLGREKEQEDLHKAWKQAKAGEGQFILLKGEAGIGKSRMVDWMKHQTLADPDTHVIELRCSPYFQHSAFYPLINDLQKNVLGKNEGVQTNDKLSRLETFLNQADLDLKTSVPLLAEMLAIPYEKKYHPLALSPPVKRIRLIETLASAWIGPSDSRPTLLIIEDLHWADPSTLDWLTAIKGILRTHAICLLGSTRPDLETTVWESAPVLFLRLQRLPIDQVEAICHFQAKTKSLPPEVLEQIKEKTDGIPLFVEELTRMVLESGLLEEKDRRYELSGPLPPLAIPTTLQDSLLARLDSLSPVKEVAQIGSVLGREFSLEMLQAVIRRDSQHLETDLEELVQAGLLLHADAISPSTYQFKHALIQDAAYESLLKSRRQVLHQRVVQVLETQFPETASSQPELLAYHLTKAGLTVKAVSQWEQAAQQTLQRHGIVETIHHAKQGLELIEQIEGGETRYERELGLLKLLSMGIMMGHGYGNPEGKQVAIRATEVARQFGDPQRLTAALQDEVAYHLHSCDYRTCVERGEELLQLTEATDELTYAHCCQMLGQASLYLGANEEAIHYLEQGLSKYQADLHEQLDFVGSGNLKALLLNVYALPLHLTGHPDQAIQTIREAEALAKKSGNLVGIYIHTNWKFLLYVSRGEYAETLSMIRPALEAANQHDHAFWKLLFGFYQLLILALEGKEEPAKAHELLNHIYQIFQTIYPYLLSLVVMAYQKSGQLEEAERILEQALATQQESGEGYGEAEMHTLKAELIHSTNPSKEAEVEKEFLHAIDISRKQSALWSELLAAKQLARFWYGQGNSEKAVGVLGKIYDQFEEGLGMEAIQDARQLLETLS